MERYLFLKKLSALFQRCHRPPQRRRARLGGISVPQQQMQLMGIEPHDALLVGFRPGLEAPLRKPFLAEPESLAVVRQTLQGVAATRTKDKKRAAERVAGQRLAAQGCEAIDTFAEIDRLDRHEDPHLRSDLNHER